MAKITKVVDFSAAHSIQGAGKCANKHGHNWVATIEVETVAGNITDPRGFIADVADLKKTAFKYDHDDLDNYFEYASTENVAYKIANDALIVVENSNPDLEVFVRVHLVETKNNSADAVATNVEFGELNHSAIEIEAENGEKTTTSGFRFVGLKGSADKYETQMVDGQIRKPELEREALADKDSSILFGGAAFQTRGH